MSAGYYDAYYKKAMQVRALIMEDFRAAFDKCDIILGPTSPSVAFKAGEKTTPEHVSLRHLYHRRQPRRHPALSLPVGKDESGMPIGLHLQAANRQEAHLLGTAQTIENLVAAW